MATPGGNTLPPRHADLSLRIATDGKDRCVSRQARRAGPQALLVGLSYWWVAAWVGRTALYIDDGGCSLERRPFARIAGRHLRRALLLITLQVLRRQAATASGPIR